MDLISREAVSSWLKQYGQNALRGIGLGEDRAAGLEMGYELTTGRPGCDMPDDWLFNGDYD